MLTQAMRAWLAMAALVLFDASATSASDHLDGPELSGTGDHDLNDLYAFQSPVNPDNTVLILTVNPFAGQVSGTTFGTDVVYAFKIDNDGDALADVTYEATFSEPIAGIQSMTMTRNGSPFAMGDTETDIFVTGGATVRGGLFDDPFFFDLEGFNNGLAFTGVDAFAGANVSGLVLEVPSSDLGGPNIGVWATTSVTHHQVDRAGRPAINTVLIPGGLDGRKDEFNESEPVDDLANFGADVEAAITSLSNAANAAALTPILLPDILTIDTSSSDGFLNGRQLADDVIDAELTLLTASSAPIGDGVDANDAPFLDVFPYLAPANVIVPEPTSLFLALFGVSQLGLLRRRT
ncbi:MAG: DUF4331 family protein [Planctomycetota bacterium]